MKRYSIRLRLLIGYTIALVLSGSGVLIALLDRNAGASGPTIYDVLPVLGTVCVILVAHLSFTQLMRSIDRITHGMATMREGQFEQIDAHQVANELHLLAGSYNTMSDALKKRTHELTDQLRRTALLTRLSIELRELLDPQEIIRDILVAIVSNTGATSASIILVGPDSTIEVASKIRDGLVIEIPYRRARQMLERGLAGWALRHERNIVLGDVNRDERWIRTSDDTEIVSAMILPLTYNRVSLGVLTITHFDHDHFTSQDLLLLECVAAQAGVALNASQRYLEERRYRDQALLMLTITQFITAQRSVHELAQELLEKSVALFNSRGSALYLAGPDNILELFAERPDMALAPLELTGHMKQRMSDLATQAWHAHTTVTDVVQLGIDMIDEPHHSNDSDPGSSLVCIALPLLHNGVAIGAFALLHYGHGAAVLSARGWSMLTMFTNMAAAAFANCQLIEQLHQRTEELEQVVSDRTTQLRRSRDLLRIVFDNLPDGLVLMNQQNQVLTANRAFCREVLGMAPEVVVGQHTTDLIRQLETSSGLKIEERAASTYSRQVIYTDRDGQQRWYEVDRYHSTSSLDDPEQLIERWRDVTRQEELHRRLLLHEQLTTLGRLAASVVHEVGNPLQGARSCLDLCREDPDLPQSAAEYLQMATSELERISQMLNRLRDLYHQPQMRWEQISINELITAIHQIMVRQLSHNQISMELKLAPDLPHISGQPATLRQMFLNLALNAQAAMPHGGIVRISTGTDPVRHQICIEITDTGAGISAERLEMIFEPFQSHNAPRTGLGLYLSKQVIEQHRGTITLESTVGVGTTVSIALPWSEHDYDQADHPDR